MVSTSEFMGHAGAVRVPNPNPNPNPKPSFASLSARKTPEGVLAVSIPHSQ